MKEIKDFRLHEKGINNLSGKKHTHNTCIEILHILDGNGTVMINNRIYPIRKNSVFFINKLDIHSAVPSDNTYKRNIINISDDLLNLLSNSQEENLSALFSSDCYILSDSESYKIDCEFRKMQEFSEHDPIYKIRIMQSICTILLILSQSNTSDSTNVNSYVSTAIDYIDRHLDEDISISEICSYVHLSKYYFCHLFKEITGMSPVKYISERRISNAKKLLISSNLSLSEIAMRSGFSSFSNFSNAFRKLEGITPGMFRKNYCNKTAIYNNNSSYI